MKLIIAVRHDGKWSQIELEEVSNGDSSRRVGSW